MDYKEVEENAKKYNDNFWNDFLKTIIQCQYCCKTLKRIKNKDGYLVSKASLRFSIHEHVKTLKCFMGCIS
jgi:hypothetical protein